MKVKGVYTAVACNRTPKSADWGKNGVIVYGACNSVVIFDPDFAHTSKITYTYVKHTARVNCVKWIANPRSPGGEIELLTGSDDKLCLLWNFSDFANPKVEKLEGHNGGVTVVNGIYSNKNNNDNNELTIVTSSADSTIKFWSKTSSETVETVENTNNNWMCFQTISLGNGFCFAISLCILPTTTNALLAAFGTDDIKIHLYSNGKYDPNKQDKISSTRQFETVEILYGHEDWIRDLDFIEITGTNELLLASASQDTFIRLWKISLCRSSAATTSPSSVSSVTTSPSKLFDFENHLGDYQLEEKIFLIDNCVCETRPEDTMDNKKPLSFSCKLDSVLFGHDGWVYGVHWNKMDTAGNLQLLSSSIDKTLIIWQLNDDDVWMEKVRVGAVGGNTMGFYGGKFSTNGKSIMGHGFLGSFHIWHQQPSIAMANDEIVDQNDGLWVPGINVGGHFLDVRDIGWEPDGLFLYSLSADQTTRIHAPWHRSDNYEDTWHEIARPQVHGYDMQCLSVLSRYRFASAAEEKIVRTFQAPGNFVENLQRLCQIAGNNYDDGLLISTSTPQGASVPSLGLSNKGVYSTELTEAATTTTTTTTSQHTMYPENYFCPMEMNGPPSEETLMQNTLWPEIHKLYGHGYDLFALCSTDDGKILASSCKASTVEHAQIILWNTVTWKQIQKLSSHQLTVTQMKFSPNGKYLLSVSRDRRWSIFEKCNVLADDSTASKSTIPKYQLKETTTNKTGIHSRIIWTCDWTYDSKYFVTGSRDGKVIIWYDTANDGDDENNLNKQETANTEILKSSSSSSTSLNQFNAMPSILELKGESITAIACSYYIYNNKPEDSYLIAIGLESGKIHLYKFNGNWTKLYTIENSFAHHLTVKKLQFRPNCGRLQLASCGEDHFVRIYEIIL